MMNIEKDIFDLDDQTQSVMDRFLPNESREPDIFDIADNEEYVEKFLEISGYAPPKERTLTEKALRQSGRTAADVVERVGGLGYDIQNQTRDLAKLAGFDITPPEELGGDYRFPSEEEIQAQITERFPEREPESRGEESFDEFVKTFTDVAMPIGNKMKVIKPIGVAAAGQLGKEIAKAGGVGETGQDLVKLGTMIMAGLPGRGQGLQTHINNLYDEARKTIQPSDWVKYDINALNLAKRTVNKGTPVEYKEKPKKLINDIEKLIQGDRLSAKDMIDIDQDINRYIGDARRAKDAQQEGLFKQIKKAHSKTIDQYAKENPSFAEAYKEAKLANQGIKVSQDIQKFIKSNANLKNMTYSSVLLGMLNEAIPGSTIAKVGIGATTAGLGISGEIMRRIMQNPALRRYYSNVLTASINQNKTALTRNLAGFERAAKKEFEDDELFNQLVQ